MYTWHRSPGRRLRKNEVSGLVGYCHLFLIPPTQYRQVTPVEIV
jgi:hypothetical protein